MDKWLAAVERDKRNVPLARKMLEDKPAGLQRPLLRRRARRQRRARRRAATPPSGPTRSPRIEAGMPHGGRHDQVRARRRCAARATARSSSPTPSGPSSSGHSRRACATTRKRGVDRTPTVPLADLQGPVPAAQPLGAVPALVSRSAACRAGRRSGRATSAGCGSACTRRRLAPRVPGAGTDQRRRSSRWCVRIRGQRARRVHPPRPGRAGGDHRGAATATAASGRGAAAAALRAPTRAARRSAAACSG